MNESDMLQWLEDLEEIPPEEDAELADLPDSFLWRHPLNQMTALSDPPSLGLPVFRGAIFSGPVGNGKHTLAHALLATLWRRRYIERNQVSLFWLTPDQLPEGLDAAEAAELMGILFENLSKPDENIRFGVIVLDRPEYYPHVQVLMSRVAREVADLEGQNAVICITEDESVVPSAMRGPLMLCRCPNPGPRQRRMILETGLRWMTPSQQTITLSPEGITVEELTARTDGRSCAELQALLLMLRSEAVSSDVGEERSVSIPLPQELILDMLELYEQAAISAKAPMVIQTVPAQPVDGSVNPSLDLNTPPVQKMPEDMDESEYLSHLHGCLNN